MHRYALNWIIKKSELKKRIPALKKSNAFSSKLVLTEHAFSVCVWERERERERERESSNRAIQNLIYRYVFNLSDLMHSPLYHWYHIMAYHKVVDHNNGRYVFKFGFYCIGIQKIKNFIVLFVLPVSLYWVNYTQFRTTIELCRKFSIYINVLN